MPETTPAIIGQSTTVRPLAWLRDEIDRMFDEVGRPARELFGTGFAAPAIDLAEKDGAYTLTAELPGLGQDDVQVTVTDHELVITGEKRREEERKGDGFLLRERRYGSFERHVALPIDAAEENVRANFDKGVLTIVIPKGADKPERGRRIPIGTAA